MPDEGNETTVNQAHSPVHWSFWAISLIALIWNVMGSANFFMQMDPEVLAGYRESERAIVEGRPLWATIGFATGVFGGALGSVLLLWRKRAAFFVFIASLIGVVIAIGHSLTIGISFGAGELIGIIAMPVLVAGFLIWYAKHAELRGWFTPN